MSTTTIRIEDELKASVAAAAQHMGQSAHAFIVDALAERVEQVELEASVHALAQEPGRRLRRCCWNSICHQLKCQIGRQPAWNMR